MKTKLFLLTALASVALVACNKEVPPQVDTENSPTLLEIRLTGSDISKATASLDPPVEVTIKKGVIFVFKGQSADPALDAKKNFDFTGSAPQVTQINITRGIRQVYVVANVNQADFNMVNTLSDLQNLANKLSLSAFRADNTALPVSGFLLNVDATNSTTTSPLSITVPLNFIGSKVLVDWDLNQLNPGLVGLTIEGVAILNVHAKSEYIATPNGAYGYDPLTHRVYDYLQGVGSTATFTGSYLPSVGLAVPTTNSHDPLLWINATSKGFDNNYTYIFENMSQKPIIVAFKGSYDGVTYYWPIVINGSLNGIGGNNAGDLTASVKRGIIYNVKAVIKGLGGEDPYAPINPGALDVSITPAAWRAVIQIDQEFN